MNKKNKLSGKEIQALLIGKTISGNFLGYLFSITHSKEGTSVFSLSKGGYTLIKENGKAWIKDDSICYQYVNLYGGLKNCGDIYNNPISNQQTMGVYLMLTDVSLMPFSVDE